MLLNILKCRGQSPQERIFQPKMSIAVKMRKPCYRYIVCRLQFIINICLLSALFYSWGEKAHEVNSESLNYFWNESKPESPHIDSGKWMRTRYRISHAHKYLSFNFYCYFKTHSFSFSLLYSFPIWIIYKANILLHFKRFVGFRKEE